MKYAQLKKINQEVISAPGQPSIRKMRLAIKSNGFIKLNDGTKIVVHNVDCGKIATIETDLETREQTISIA